MNFDRSGMGPSQQPLDGDFPISHVAAWHGIRLPKDGGERFAWKAQYKVEPYLGGSLLPTHSILFTKRATNNPAAYLNHVPPLHHRLLSEYTVVSCLAKTDATPRHQTT